MHYIQENIAKGDTPEKMFDMGEEVIFIVLFLYSILLECERAN